MPHPGRFDGTTMTTVHHHARAVFADIIAAVEPAIGAAGSDLLSPGIQNLQHHHGIPDLAENLFRASPRAIPGVTERMIRAQINPATETSLVIRTPPHPVSDMPLLSLIRKWGTWPKVHASPRKPTLSHLHLFSQPPFLSSRNANRRGGGFTKRKGRAASADPAFSPTRIKKHG